VRHRLVLSATLVAALLGSACAPDEREAGAPVPGGDAALGVAAMRRHGCGGCHVIPGLPESRGRVGPSLAGARPNRPIDLIEWIRAPQTIHPGTLMPGLGVTPAEARDMAAHLYSLR
jgi:mono/diheme cytochrome c family protein